MTALGDAIGRAFRWPPTHRGDVDWRDPPGHIGAGPVAKDAHVPALLRSRPGVWAAIRMCDSKGAARDYANSRRVKWGDTYEITTRGLEVFARYVGEGDE